MGRNDIYIEKCCIRFDPETKRHVTSDTIITMFMAGVPLALLVKIF
jgi:hypothetical protein